MDGVCTDVTLISAVSCDRDFVDSLASVMTEGSLTLCICSMWCWMRCPDIFRRWRAWQSHALLLASQSAIFRLGLFLFIKKSEVRINGTDSQITSLVVLKQLEELSAQYDNDNQVYKGRYSRCQIGDFPNIRTRNIVSHRSQKHYKEPGNGVDYLKYVNQGPLELFIRAAQMAQQHFEISPPSGSSRKSKEENGHRDDDSSNRPKHCFESRQGQWSTIQAGIPQAGNDDNQGGNRADTHRTDKNLKCPHNPCFTGCSVLAEA